MQGAQPSRFARYVSTDRMAALLSGNSNATPRHVPVSSFSKFKVSPGRFRVPQFLTDFLPNTRRYPGRSAHSRRTQP
jgi:hypothetical protein